MTPRVRRVQVEPSTGAAPARTFQFWTSAVGPGFFEAFERPILAGRDFHGGDRSPDARTVIVNEAFMRLFTNGASPIGRRVRYASEDPDAPQPWFEIVGVVRDIGMTPISLGEAPYLFHAASASTVRPAVMGVRVKGDPAVLAPRVRAIAGEVEPGLRLGDVRWLDDVVWRAHIVSMVGAAALMGIVGVGLFCSAAGIFSLMSVTVARRTREIGLRAALGASPGRLLRGIFSRAAVLVGSGVVAGNLVLLLLVFDREDVPWLLMVSSLTLIVGLLACVGPARRALRINPADALKDA